MPQYYVENSHEAIIPREIFMQVQEELIRRRCVHLSQNGKKRNFSSNHCFSNMVFCGECGEVFRRIHWNNRGKKSIVWRCISRLENTGLFCDARTVQESEIQEVVMRAINNTLGQKDDFLSILQHNIEVVLSRGGNKGLEEINKRLEELQIELLKLATSKSDFEDVVEEIHRLRDEKQKAQLESAGRDETRIRIADMKAFLRKQDTSVMDFDEALVRRLIEKITVYEGRVVVMFRSGVEVEV